jgi:hypothetical protein
MKLIHESLDIFFIQANLNTLNQCNEGVANYRLRRKSLRAFGVGSGLDAISHARARRRISRQQVRRFNPPDLTP